MTPRRGWRARQSDAPGAPRRSPAHAGGAGPAAARWCWSRAAVRPVPRASPDRSDRGDVETIEPNFANRRHQRRVEGVAHADLASRGYVAVAVGHDAAAWTDFPRLPLRRPPVEER